MIEVGTTNRSQVKPLTLTDVLAHYGRKDGDVVQTIPASKVRPGFWNCCNNRTAYAVSFINGNGVEVWHKACLSCASTVSANRVAIIGAWHFDDGADRPACSREVRKQNMTTDTDKVTCRRCQATTRFSNATKSGVQMLADMLSLDGETPAVIIPAAPVAQPARVAPTMPGVGGFYLVDGSVVMVRMIHPAGTLSPVNDHNVVVTERFGADDDARRLFTAPQWLEGNPVAIPTPGDPGGCRATCHEYCTGGCGVHAWVRASRQAAHTTVETEQQTADRIKRHEYRPGDVVNFASTVGYVKHENRPWECRSRYVCQCGKCNGMKVDNWQVLAEVIHWGSGGLDIRAVDGSHATIRPDRLD